MKKTCISLCLIVFAVLQAYAASSWKETRTVVFTPAGSEKTHLLQPDQSISETVTFGQSGIDAEILACDRRSKDACSFPEQR